MGKKTGGGKEEVKGKKERNKGERAYERGAKRGEVNKGW